MQLGATLAAWPAILLAQPAKRFRVGCLWLGSESSAKSFQDALTAGLRDLGYVVGGNLIVDVRYAGGAPSRLPALADELIALGPDVLVGVEAPARAIRTRTVSIPIVLASSVDPVATGLVQSLARPGVNVTGMAYRLDELVAKNLELLIEVVPKASKVALLTYGTVKDDLSAPIEARIEQSARAAATAKGLRLAVAKVRDAESVRQVFATLEVEGCDGIVVVPSPYTLQLRYELVGQARRLRLPSISALGGSWAEAGGLISYGPDFIKNYRYAAVFVDRLLKGAKAAEMPLEQPTTFELVVNLSTAKAIGAAIPGSVLVRADRVIE
jgi:putative ABC transport system substrate-binding protein